ncbi:MAG: Holliday junction branch migration protein RuvA [Lachnospiraceae bacterium]|nr:Holliday junction branch migration protein RuvA [Lachnospiraceae bacterium]
MIRFIRGTLVSVGENEVVLENHGIGYRIIVPVSVVEKAAGENSEILLHTYLNVREDAMQLFGFLTEEDLKVFQLLITVNGVGPKAALGILGVLGAYELRFAVIAGDAKAIAKAPGIGAKTASKVILELKDKFEAEELLAESIEAEGGQALNGTGAANGIVQDAIEALTALGYAKTDAARAVRSVAAAEDMTVEELLKRSLKEL